MGSEILTRLQSEILLFDGAMGTKLQEAGLDTKTAPEEWNLKRPEVVKGIQEKYLTAGSQIIQTNTFGANRLKLGEYDLADQVAKINRRAVELAKEVHQDNYISGSVGPLGKFLAPIGNITFAEAVDIFQEQMTALVEAGVDLISIETMSSLQEIRAAVIAAREVSKEVAVIAQMTFDENLRTLSGTTPQIAAVVLESLGADIIGANCSLGPAGLLEVLKELKQVTDKPLIVQPNAGLPEVVDGEVTYQQTPEEMADYIEEFVEHGANIIGGCCGTTPQHIRTFARKLEELQPVGSFASEKFRVASRAKLIELTDKDESLAIGERINPGSCENLIADLQQEDLKVVREEAKSQADTGVKILNIDIDSPEIEEEELMKEVVEKVQNASRAAIAIETENLAALEVGLRTFAGKAVVNFVTGEEESLKQFLPLVKKYGAALIGLTLNEEGIPGTAEGKLKIARKIKKRVVEFGISPQNILINPLVLTAVENQAEIVETLRAIKLIKEELGLKTVLRVGGVSSGLPARTLLNQTFLAMAFAYGLDAYIVDPLEGGLEETILAAELLINRDPNGKKYINSLQE